jgi:hypothetical protein
MKLRCWLLVVVFISSFGNADQNGSSQALPTGFPENGQFGIIAEIDTNNYEIMVNGLRTPVYRAAKIVTPQLERIFLFQIPIGSGVLLISDKKGMVVEIWLLPTDFEVPQS